jgi:hypothetical protein
LIQENRSPNADWAAPPGIPLNPGLVAIIGARGSGKTALVDVIAAGCDAISTSGWDADEDISPSFLARARRLISDATVKRRFPPPQRHWNVDMRRTSGASKIRV